MRLRQVKIGPTAIE